LARNLAPTPPVSDLFGKTGRHWLSIQPLPTDERSSVHALLRQLDFHGAELALVDKGGPDRSGRGPFDDHPGVDQSLGSPSLPPSATSTVSTTPTGSSPT
jgi:hypothetical protein